MAGTVPTSAATTSMAAKQWSYAPQNKIWSPSKQRYVSLGAVAGQPPTTSAAQPAASLPPSVAAQKGVTSVWWQGWWGFGLKLLLIIGILLLLGINIIAYLAKGTDRTARLAQRFLAALPKGLRRTFRLTKIGAKAGTRDIKAVPAGLRDTIKFTKKGAAYAAEKAKPVTQALVDTKNLAKKGLHLAGVQTANIGRGLEDTVKFGRKGVKFGEHLADRVVGELAGATGKVAGAGAGGIVTSMEEAVDDALSIRPRYRGDTTRSHIQQKRKPNWCYIGTEGGYRSCIRVKDEDKCLSGEIFPSRRICINPSLRG